MTPIRLLSRTTLGLAALAVLSSGQQATAQSSEPYPSLDAYIANAVKVWNVPGLSVVIVRNDSVIYTKGFGVLRTGTTTPVNERTLFEIGSNSTAVTAPPAAAPGSPGQMRCVHRRP